MANTLFPNPSFAMIRAAPPTQIVDILANSLGIVFDGLCTERYGGSLALTRVLGVPLPPSTGRFRLHHPAVPPLLADFTVHPIGGTVYDVQGTVENGPSRTFIYSLTEARPFFLPQAPHLAQDVAMFLLNALEQRMGSDLLRTTLRDRRPSP